MQYHEPDPIWVLFGITDYDIYLDLMVIKGKFHSSVPQEVVKDYAIAEHMMAYAWYCHQLYDEAYSKVLRIMERAVKKRCEHLGIKADKKQLAVLINEISAKEPAKNLEELLQKLRGDRNKYMHANIESDKGGLLRARMRRCVVMLNVLFVEDSYFSKTHAHKLTMMDEIAPFKSGAFVLGIEEGDKLIEGALLTGAYYTATGWVYCLHIATVPAAIDKVLEQDYPVLVPFHVTGLLIGKDTLSACLAHNGKLLTIKPTRHPIALQQLDKYNKMRDSAPQEYIKQAELMLAMDFDISRIMFVYEWLWQYSTIK